MSWSCTFTGTKDAVKAKASEYFDKTAESYKGQAEADDITACKGRALALIDALDLTSDAYTTWNGVVLEAGGSHSTSSGKLVNANFKLSVVRTSLCL